MQGLRTGVSITLKDEVALLAKFDALMAIQNEEARWMARLLPNKIVLCCPHGVESVSDILTARLEARRGCNLRLGFVGGGSNENAEAIGWFLREVYPVVSQLAIELHVYGNVCEKLRNQPLDAGVTLHGLVPQLDVPYAHCDVMINPSCMVVGSRSNLWKLWPTASLSLPRQKAWSALKIRRAVV